MPTVTNNTGRVQGMRIDPGSGMKTLDLQPGANDVSKADFDALGKWSPFQAMTKAGDMAMSTSGSEPDSKPEPKGKGRGGKR